MDSPLTPGEALAVAAILDVAHGRQPHIKTLVQRLRDWAHTHRPPTEEGDDPRGLVQG